MVHGIGQAMASATARPATIALGKLTLPDPPVIVGAFSTGDLPGGAPDGLLGADILAGFDVEVDVSRGRLALFPPCGDPRPPWSPPYAVLQGKLLRGRFFVPLTLDEVRLAAALDTGAEYSLVSSRAAEAAGVSAAELALDPAASIVVVGPQPVTVRLHRFRELRLGPEVWANPPLLVMPARQAPVDGILGMDYLRHYRLWLSYATGLVFVGAPAL
jgi:hypothetical protein